MTAQGAFIVFKKIDDEIQVCRIQPHEYINYRLTDPRKIKIYQSLIDSGVDVKKFFLANCCLNKEFFIDFYKYNPDRCMTLYYSWDEFLVKKRAEYFRRVLDELKKGIKLDLNDRDEFLSLLPVTDYLLWSALYPEDLDLLESMESDWTKFNMPEYRTSMDYVKRVIRGNLVLKQMPRFNELRTAALRLITK